MHEKTDLQKIYDFRFPDEVRKTRKGLWSVLVSTFLQKLFNDNDTILDVGSGRGEFINEVKAASKIAVDLNPDAMKYLAKDVVFLNVSADDMSPIKSASINGVFSSNFFEHLPDKKTLDKVFAEIERVLVPGGTLVCLGPNIRYVGPAYWDFYDHHIPLSEKSLTEALELANLKVEKVVPKFLPFTTKSNLPQSSWLVWIYLKFPWAWQILGKQFLVIARKKS